jgi:hypothetical protein
MLNCCGSYPLIIWNQPSWVVGQELLLDAFYTGASKVGCSGCVFELVRKLSDELVTPTCPRVAEVQVGYSLGRNAFQTGISCIAVFDRQLVTSYG